MKTWSENKEMSSSVAHTTYMVRFSFLPFIDRIAIGSGDGRLRRIEQLVEGRAPRILLAADSIDGTHLSLVVFPAIEDLHHSLGSHRPTFTQWIL